jgi:hypothetical protein
VFEPSRFLSEFVACHPGLRLGSLFGRPAAYAGRHVFARVMANGIACRLPADEARRWLKQGARAASAQRGTEGWVVFPPRWTADPVRLEAVLERAVQHVTGPDGPAAQFTPRRRKDR